VIHGEHISHIKEALSSPPLDKSASLYQIAIVLVAVELAVSDAGFVGAVEAAPIF
jgi:hypothetical protein